MDLLLPGRDWFRFRDRKLAKLLGLKIRFSKRKRWTVADVAPNKPLCFKAAAAATQHLCELCDRNLLGHRRVPEVDVLYVPEERPCESSVAWAPQCNQLQVGSAIDEICGDRICGGRGGGGAGHARAVDPILV